MHSLFIFEYLLLLFAFVVCFGAPKKIVFAAL